jgi:L-alanine-DL-glutamate epimerase-like enolase superfamily enzyme
VEDELTTAVPGISGGVMTVPSGPGWGADVNEDVLRAHPWSS